MWFGDINVFNIPMLGRPGAYGKRRMKDIPFKIDRNGSASLPEQVAAGFRLAIRSGYYKPGDILPPRGEMADRLGISERIPREAMRILSDENLVRPGRGVGCVVLSRRETLHNGRVLIIERAICAGSYSVSVIAEEVRRRLMEAGYLYTSVSVDVRHGGRSLDLHPVEEAFCLPTDFAFAMFPTANLVRFLRKRGPFLALGGDCYGDDAVDISWSQARGHLLAQCRERGVRKILFSSYGCCDEELSAFRSAGFEVENIPIWPKDRFGFLEATEHGAFKAFRRRFAHKRRFPDLIYFGDDYVARGGLMALMSCGVRVPDDVKVVSLVNKGAVPSFPVSLSRIEYDPVAAGALIAGSIVARMKGKADAPRPVCVRYIPGDSFR